MKFTLFGNTEIVYRIFEPLETAHQDDRYVDTGVEVSGRKHAIGVGAASPLFSARGADETRPIVDGLQNKSKEAPSPDKTDEAKASN